MKNSQVFYPQWPFPPPALGTRGHRWSATPISESVGIFRPTGLWVCPDHCRRLCWDQWRKTKISLFLIDFIKFGNLKFKCIKCLFCTSQILDEIFEFHFPLRLHIGAVHVSVEEDDGKSQDEDGVWVLELPNQGGIADTIPLTKDKNKIENVLFWKQQKL